MKDLRFSPTILASQVVFAIAMGVIVAHHAPRAPGALDFPMLWAAHQTADPYNPKAVSAVLGCNGGCWFPYAPPFLLLIAPFGMMPLRAAYVSWVCLSAAAITASLRRPAAPVVLLIPAVFLAGGIGQTSLLMGAMLYPGATMSNRPLVAGALFGLAAVIKPQAVFLLPIVLIAARQWLTIVAACATGAALGLAATLIFGWHVWGDWLESLPAFIAANDGRWTGRYLSLPGLLKLVGFIGGAVGCSWAARAKRIEQAVFVAVAGALLSSPHAMDYDAAILAPFAIAAALDARWWGIPFWIAAFLPASAYTVAALALMACALHPSFRRPNLGRSPSRLSGILLWRMEHRVEEEADSKGQAASKE